MGGPVSRFNVVQATIGVVAALIFGSVTDCNAQSPLLAMPAGLRNRTTELSRDVPPFAPKTDHLSDASPTPDSTERKGLTVSTVCGLGISEKQSQATEFTRGASAQADSAANPADSINPGTGQREATDGFRWGGAVKQSVFFLGIMHGFRMATEPESRADLRGPFFKDYFATVRKVRGWEDGDPFIVNYIGHPMQGAVTGFVQIQNDPKATRQELSMSKEYWRSRLKAMGWAALFSTQFELGPISEASLGNIGLKLSDKGKNPMALVDLVVTPTVGTAWLVGEDALDRYLIRGIESKVTNRLVRLLVRSLLNPSRSMSNLLRLKYPWHRDTRSLRQKSTATNSNPLQATN